MTEEPIAGSPDRDQPDSGLPKGRADAGQPGPARSRLAKASPANMLRSLLPLVVIVLGLAYFCTPTDVSPVTEVDPTGSIRYAASLTGSTLLVPELDDGWRPTSVDVTAPDVAPGPVTLTIGYVTPSDEFARYVVSTDPSSQLIDDLLAGADAVTPVSVGGQTWEAFTTSRGERLLLRTGDGLRLLVTGSAPEDELATLAGSLVPYRP